MAFLFDTDAISELLRPRPAIAYVKWIMKVAREEQFTSAVVIGELYKGAYRSQHRERHLTNIEQRVLAAVSVLPYDTSIAKVFGKIRAHLEEIGTILPDADIQIAATAITHNLELITGNLRHFRRVPDLQVNNILANSRNQ
ncbi:type II toxin-antitoxin system VapC family toxin [Desulfatiglans anilini]|uniref:type II toxin-antitoxin system VapC family toxin n=1 Tax=Desulfatiglans anilini TaxID=90728 RepID=UPI000486BE67|nr:type II toxin-antitoxin system VapC family toxin [Desulfatiglans anilini]